ncbi:UNVERIFIED_CONTAM: Formin-like protein 11 [Sesamum radiatum]|uniref:Formin-like protein n=1 Tax=Sesamum radiatum TaxID=300843 RepID=A0AAW2U7V0_SESRA
MGHASHLLHMLSVVIFFVFSFYFTHIFIGNSSLGVEGRNGGYLRRRNQDQKFRFLLGFKSFSIGKSRNGGSDYFSPSPSPSPLLSPVPGGPSIAPAPSPPPRSHLHHGHPPSHHRHSIPEAHKVQKKNKERAARVLTAVLASAGGVTFVLCAVALFFLCLKFKKQKRRKRRSRVTSKFSVSSQVKKVSSDPGPDLFYLNSLQSALEPEKCCLKLSSSTEKTGDEREGSNKKLINSECDSGRCSSSYGEITTVHEISEAFKNENHHQERVIPEEVQRLDDKIVHEEAHSSDDDESFHSFCDSHSSQLRLSNASDIISEDDVKETQIQIPQSNPILSAPRHRHRHRHRHHHHPPPPRFVPVSPSPVPSSKKTKSNFLNSSTLSSLSQSSLPATPPTPPAAPAGIPPPPCPPPLSKGHVFSHNAPPPPPLQLTQQMPLGKDGSPLPKLKPLHWDKVRAAPNRSTVWDKLRSSSFEFDEEMIESLFGYNLQNSIKNDEGKSKTPSPSKHVLEPKRLQNITILSKALNVTAEQVCGALIRGDGLSLQDLEALSKMVPTKEEENKLANYKGDIFELGSAEKLVMAMLKIPFAFPRIEAMLYRETFEDEVLHLRKSFSMLEEACKELRSSRLFLKLLEAVLKTGNRMNVGTIRGGAKAFKLDALLKLADVKGTDGKTTLLHFVVQEIIRSEGLRVSESIMGKINQRSKSGNIEDKEENYRRMGLDLVSGLSTELCNAKKTATIDLDVLASSVTNLADGMRRLQTLVEKDMIMEEKKGSFVSSMRSFLKQAEMKLKELEEDENLVMLNVREITEYFHGDVSKDESNPLRIFVIVRDFLSMLDHVCKELRSAKAPRSPNPPAPFR